MNKVRAGADCERRRQWLPCPRLACHGPPGLHTRSRGVHTATSCVLQVNTKVDMRLRLDAATWLDEEIREAVRRAVRRRGGARTTGCGGAAGHD